MPALFLGFSLSFSAHCSSFNSSPFSPGKYNLWQR
jgi:hypothetical protein